MATSIERLLKQKRIEKELTLNDITRDLKIRKEYIKQFETKIPEPLGVYELGYLRSYARYLGVDIHDYIANLKARRSAAAVESRSQSEKKFFGKIRISSNTLTIAFSVVGVLASIMFLFVVNNGYFNDSGVNTAEIPISLSSSQKNNVVNIATNFAIKQEGPYNYVIQGVDSSRNVNIIARANTNFTIIDSSKNKVVYAGAIRAGERVFVPKLQDGNIFTTILIKTTVPDALEIQNDSSNK